MHLFVSYLYIRGFRPFFKLTITPKYASKDKVQAFPFPKWFICPNRIIFHEDMDILMSVPGMILAPNFFNILVGKSQ